MWLKRNGLVIANTIRNARRRVWYTFSQFIINECPYAAAVYTAFDLPLVTGIIRKQNINFLLRYCATDNCVCKLFSSNAEREIKALRLNLNCKFSVTVYIASWTIFDAYTLNCFIVHFINNFVSFLVFFTRAQGRRKVLNNGGHSLNENEIEASQAPKGVGSCPLSSRLGVWGSVVSSPRGVRGRQRH